MNHRTFNLGMILLSIIFFNGQSQQNDLLILKEPYLGQKPPGKTREIFAPRFISTGMSESAIVVRSDNFGQKYWEKAYGGPEREIGWSVQVTRDGGYIIGGLTHSYGAGEIDFYLIKTDSDGNLEWQRTFGGKGMDLCTNVQLTSDEGYVLCGTTGFGSGGSDVYIVKTYSNGLLEWEKTYGGRNAERGSCIKQTGDRGYIICGETSSIGAGEADIYLIKIDSRGEKEWDKTFGGPNRDWGTNIQLTSDGGYIIGGNTKSYGQGKTDVFLIKINKNGEKEWEKTYGGQEEDYIFGTEALIQAKDGGFIFCAYSESYGEGMTDFYIVKTELSGETEWEKTFGGSEEDGPLSILQTKDCSYLICGYTKSIGEGDRDVYLIKIDKNGKKEWEKTYGGTDFDCGIAIQQKTDGGLIICGETKSYGAGERDVFLIKTNSVLRQNDFPVLNGPYLGQKPPGKTPELFAPGIISTCTQHSSVYFSRDGKEVYFSRMYPLPSVIMYMHEEKGQWTSPQIVCEGLTPGLDPDGKTVFFSASKPTSKLYKLLKTAGGWTEPELLPSHINFQRRQDTPYVAADGTLYFCSMFGEADGIYKARLKNGVYLSPERIEYGISNEGSNFSPYIAPDESYMIFSSTRPGYGITDLYISFYNKDGSWTQPKNMGPKINTSANEAFPFVSFDGKYLFFMSNRVSALNKTPVPEGPGNVYWMCAKIIEEFASKD